MDFTKVKSALEARGFKVSAFPTAAEAARYLNGQIDGVSVSFGGSVTLEQMGLFESLGQHNEVLSHWHVPAGKDPAEIRAKAMTTEVYLTSVNGLAETGEIVNIDGFGNRVAGTLYGHKKVYFIIGRNKLAPTFEDAGIVQFAPSSSHADFTGLGDYMVRGCNTSEIQQRFYAKFLYNFYGARNVVFLYLNDDAGNRL